MRVHNTREKDINFSKDTDKTFKDRVQKLIINECLEKIRNNPKEAIMKKIGDVTLVFSASEGRLLYVNGSHSDVVR